MSSGEGKGEGKTLTQHVGDTLQSAKETVVGKAEETPQSKADAHKRQADSSAGSTWESIKGAASSAKEQASSTVDKNASELQAKTKEGTESIDNTLQKQGAKAEGKEHKEETKSYLSSAWDGVKNTASHLTGAANNKAEGTKAEAGAKGTEAREKAASTLDPHKK